MRLVTCALIAVLFCMGPRAARAQPIGQPQTIDVVDSGTACVTAPTACATFNLDASTAAVTFSVSGTWTGTLTFEATNNAAIWTSLFVTSMATGAQVTTATANGLWGVTNAGFVRVRARATAAVTGSALVTAGKGFGSVRNTPGFVSGVLAATAGGTGQSSYAVGDLLSASTTTALSKVAAPAVGQVLASAGTSTLPAWSAAPTLTTSLSVNRASTGTSVTIGLGTTASTAAADGAQQDAPWLQLSSNGWNNVSAASHVADFGFRNRPVQGNPITSALVLFQQINGGGYSTVGTWTNAGAYTAGTSLTAGTTVSATTTSNFGTNLLSNAAIAYNGSAAALVSGFSTTTPTVSGKSSSFSVLVAATPGVTGQVSFATSFTNVPACVCNNQVTANAIQCVPTVSGATLNGIWVAGDTLRCVVIGY